MGSVDELGLWPLEVGGGAESSNPLVGSAATSPILLELLHLNGGVLERGLL